MPQKNGYFFCRYNLAKERKFFFLLTATNIKYWQLKNVLFGASLGFPDIFSWATDCEDGWRGENS